MARANIRLVVLVAVAAIVFSAPLIAARNAQPFVNRREESEVACCVGSAGQLLQDHEGRNRWAYNHRGGFRAVGAGYNLDDNPEERRKELEEALSLDYDKVYKGEIFLDELQISELLILDAKRALRRAEKNVERFSELCCSLRAVFADIQHTAGSADKFPRDDLDKFIEKAASEDYENAAEELKRTKWCSERRNRGRCCHNFDFVKQGCSKQQGSWHVVSELIESLTLLNKVVPSKGGF
ncbi:hypothetical protein R1flu_026332 [Riccia fluitans]|uniref:Uncharacterized protein n=1 Tax=Riccia fluitans TaxID=41844 RepID=A0ABD1XFN0_9MARC